MISQDLQVQTKDVKMCFNEGIKGAVWLIASFCASEISSDVTGNSFYWVVLTGYSVVLLKALKIEKRIETAAARK